MLWLHFRKLAAHGEAQKKLKGELMALLSAHGEVGSLVIMYGRGQALAKLPWTEEHLSTFLSQFKIDETTGGHVIQLEGWTKPAAIQRGAERVSEVDAAQLIANGQSVRIEKGWDIHNDVIIRQETDRCLNALLRSVVTADSLERMRARRLNNKRYKSTLNALESKRFASEEIIAVDRKSVCWHFAQCGGRHECPPELNCGHLMHILRPVRELPKDMRAIVPEDAFPLARELSPFKTEINCYLTEISSRLPNKNCLVLDGAACNSSRKLLECPVQRRVFTDIIVPNYCIDSFELISKSDCCEAYLGSARAYMEDNIGRSFGLIYLDYCGRLSAGYSNIEKSPLGDIEYIFHKHFLDADSESVLAVCLCQEADGENDATIARLDELVFTNAAESDYEVSKPFKSFKYGVVFVEIYRLVGSSQQSAAEQPSESLNAVE